MRIELGAGPASLTACRALAAVAHTLNPPDRRGGADLEAGRSLARRRSASSRLDHPVPQILTVCSSHSPSCLLSDHGGGLARSHMGIRSDFGNRLDFEFS